MDATHHNKRMEKGLAFLREVEAVDNLQETVARYLAVIADFGFPACAAGAWVGVGAARTYRFYFNSWPDEWKEVYARNGFFADDPAVALSRQRMTPFLFTEEEQIMRQLPGGAAVLEVALAFGWKEVFCVPIHGPGSYQALVSLGAFTSVDLDARDRWIIAAMSHAIHKRCHSKVGFGSRPAPHLSARQVECMRWAALGKSDSEIAKIMGISAPTAHYHVERVKSRSASRRGSRRSRFWFLDGVLDRSRGQNRRSTVARTL